MLRRVILPGVCALGLVLPLLPLLGSGCAKSEGRARMAKHGHGILVYKQLVTVSRAAEAEPSGPAGDAEEERVAAEQRVATEERVAAEEPGEPEPIARTDVPPEPWVHAAPAPDVPPLPEPAKAPEAVAEAPLPEVVAARVVADAPAALPARPAPEPIAMEQPAPLPEVDLEPKVVVFVPGAHTGDVAPAAAEMPVPGGIHPSMEAPIINLVVLAPIVALQTLVAGPQDRQRLIANAARLAAAARTPVPSPAIPVRPAQPSPPRVPASPRVR